MDEITSYEAADERLYNRFGVAVESRKLRNNTYLQRRGTDEVRLSATMTLRAQKIAVRLHNTDIVTFYSDGQIELNTGGWFTITTKDRMNRYLPAPFSIFSVNGSWHVSLSWKTTKVHSEWAHEKYASDEDICGNYCYDRKEVDQSAPYFDGIILDVATASVVNVEDVPDAGERDKRNEEMRRKIKNYLRRYTDERIRELVNQDAAGDCWFCMMEHSQLKSEVNPKFATAGGDHLQTHVDEQYVMATLLWNAIKASGRRDPAFVMAYAPDLARHDLSKYLRKRLLEATMVNH
jgi:hypothetical protein